MLLLAPMVLAACGGAPQVTAIVPARGSGSIHSDAPIQITFSTAMNERSVEQRVSLQPVADSLLSLPW
ncbi:MAG: Ig-like domain-containing protein, partial [Candidatus Dormibacteraceae bacterium]